MILPMTATAAGRRRRTKKEVSPDKVTNRTKMGAREIRKGDIVRVRDPRDAGEEFCAQVVGGYTLEQKWWLILGPLPHVPHTKERKPPRTSTKARHVREHWRRERGRS